jgi:hypothetical protein
MTKASDDANQHTKSTSGNEQIDEKPESATLIPSTLGKDDEADTYSPYIDSSGINDDDSLSNFGYSADSRDRSYKDLLFKPDAEGLVRGHPPPLLKQRLNMLRPVAPVSDRSHQSRKEPALNMLSDVDANMFAPRATVVQSLNSKNLEVCLFIGILMPFYLF